MSRQSTDHYSEGRLMHGFDYVNQAWVMNGRYIECGHPETMACDCYGREHKGEPTPTGRLDGSEPAPIHRPLHEPMEPGTFSHDPEATATECDLEPADAECPHCDGKGHVPFGSGSTPCECHKERTTRLHYLEGKPGISTGRTSEPSPRHVEACRTLLTTFDKIEKQKEQAQAIIKEVSGKTLLGLGARIALRDLTEKDFPAWYRKILRLKPKTTEAQARDFFDQGLTPKEAAWNWEEMDKHAAMVEKQDAVDKEQAQTMVNQLIGPPPEEVDVLTGPTFSEYFTTRREQLRADLDHMVRVISTPGSDTPDNLRNRLNLSARLAELDRARQEIGADGYPDDGPDRDSEVGPDEGPDVGPDRNPDEDDPRC